MKIVINIISSIFQMVGLFLIYKATSVLTCAGIFLFVWGYGIFLVERKK